MARALLIKLYLLLLLQVSSRFLSSNRPLIIASAVPLQSHSSSSVNTCAADSSPDCGNASNKEVKVEDNATEEETVSTPWAFMEAFSKLGTSWSHIIEEYISVVGNADGKELRGDVYAENGIEEGLKLMYSMVNEAASLSAEDKVTWSFRTTPLADFGKTVDDLLLAFLRWSVVDAQSPDNGDTHDDDSCQLIGGINHSYSSSSTPQKINVSKAFRRLTSYIHWMDSVSSYLLDPPLTYQSIAPSLSVFSIYITHDSCGRLVWWVHLGKTHTERLKSQSPKETTRMFVWVAHLLFLDEGAQTKGLVVVDDMSEIGFWEYMTMLPVQVGISVDRFLISVTPLKAKNVVLMHRPKWAEIGYRLLSWFLTAKMKSRVTMVERGEEVAILEKIVGGAAFIPSDFGDVKGELLRDMIAQQR